METKLIFSNANDIRIHATSVSELFFLLGVVEQQITFPKHIVNPDYDQS